MFKVDNDKSTTNKELRVLQQSLKSLCNPFNSNFVPLFVRLKPCFLKNLTFQNMDMTNANATS